MKKIKMTLGEEQREEEGKRRIKNHTKGQTGLKKCHRVDNLRENNVIITFVCRGMGREEERGIKGTDRQIDRYING